MSGKKKGIILRSFLPYKQKLSVLSRSHGKLSIVIPRARCPRTFSPGTTIVFLAKTTENFPIARNVEIVSIPILEMKSHMSWLHQIIEIAYYFAPLGAPCADLFGLLQWCLTFAKNSEIFEPHFSVIKKICLVKLLMLLGFYSDKGVVSLSSLFDRIVFIFLDSANSEKVSSLHALLQDVCDDELQRVDKWLWLCLQEHPQAARFKTISKGFL